MADIICFRTDLHREIRELLPWYARDALASDELARVKAHLDSCPQCRAELQADLAISALLTEAEQAPDVGWLALKGRVAASEALRRAPRRRRGTWAAVLEKTRSAWVQWFQAPRWMLAAQIAGLVIVGTVGFSAGGYRGEQYHALSSAWTPGRGDMVVVFRPTTTEADMSRVLERARARVTDGPTRTEAFVLRSVGGSRAVALETLRADPQVVLAEPLSASSAS